MLPVFGAWWNPWTWNQPSEEPLKAIIVRPVLQIGMEGDDVRAVQVRLTQLDYPVRVTGKYDDTTAAYVSMFQYAIGVTVDGKVGKETRLRLFATKNLSLPFSPTLSSQSTLLALLAVGALFLFRRT